MIKRMFLAGLAILPWASSQVPACATEMERLTLKTISPSEVDTTSDASLLGPLQFDTRGLHPHIMFAGDPVLDPSTRQQVRAVVQVKIPITL